MMMASTIPVATSVIFFASAAQYIFGILLTLTALFLIMLVLVQRGRGGGLAGAFGGMGGQSAFGTKAGDTFTKITIGVSIFWLLLCIFSVRFLGTDPGAFGRVVPPDAPQLAPRSTGTEATDAPLLPETPAAGGGPINPSTPADTAVPATAPPDAATSGAASGDSTTTPAGDSTTTE